MFMTKRKMKEEIMRLNYRVADLEERPRTMTGFK